MATGTGFIVDGKEKEREQLIRLFNKNSKELDLALTDKLRRAIDYFHTNSGKEVNVRELLNLVLKQTTNIKTDITLANLYDKIQLRALESLGVTSDK